MPMSIENGSLGRRNYQEVEDQQGSIHIVA